MMTNHNHFFMSHLSEAVKDKYDLSDDQMHKLLGFLIQFDNPKVALKKALLDKNQESIKSVIKDLMNSDQLKEYRTGPVTSPSMLSVPTSIPLSIAELSTERGSNVHSYI